jgi:hypothetical protein
VIVAPVDLKFELWFNSKKYNRSHDPILEWDEGGAPAKLVSEDRLVDEWGTYTARAVRSRLQGRGLERTGAVEVLRLPRAWYLDLSSSKDIPLAYSTKQAGKG